MWSLGRADHSSRGVIPTVVRRCVWYRNIKNMRSIYMYDISGLRVKMITYLKVMRGEASNSIWQRVSIQKIYIATIICRARSSIPRPLEILASITWEANVIIHLSFIYHRCQYIVTQEPRCLFRGECRVLRLTSRPVLRQADVAAVWSRQRARCANFRCQ